MIAVAACVDVQFMRFAGVGALGFLIDAGILTWLVTGAGLGHYSSRTVSFAAAASLTWYLNRRLTFRSTERPGSQYARFLGVQITGAAINLSVYVALLELVPPLAAWPAIALGAGAALSLLFTFTASRRSVFTLATTQPSCERTSTYAGRDNLEAMEHARNYNAHLLGLVEPLAVGRILDFGAGTGTFARRLARTGHDVLCVEPDERLRVSLSRAGHAVITSVAEVPDESIDLVYSFNVLEHIDKDEEALAQLRRVLRPGGVLLLYVPAFDMLYSAMDRKVGHVRRYRKRSLVAKVVRAGFSVERAHYADSLGFFAAFAYKLVGDPSGEITGRTVALYDTYVFPWSRRADHVFGAAFGKNLCVVARRG